MEKGKNIASFHRGVFGFSGTKIVIDTNTSGFLFRFCRNSIRYAVISIGDDNLEDIMKWVSEVQ